MSKCPICGANNDTSLHACVRPFATQPTTQPPITHVLQGVDFALGELVPNSAFDLAQARIAELEAALREARYAMLTHNFNNQTEAITNIDKVLGEK